MTPPATIAAGHPARTTRRKPTQRPPRRVSGPARPKRDPRAGSVRAGAAGAGGAAVARPPLAMRLGTRAMRIGDARLLDRLVRGRAWIAIMAIGLLGIVFMQVSLLKLNAGISRAVTAGDTLDRQNSSLREDISKLDSGERVQDAAARLGMVTPAAGDVHYLNGANADGARAAAAIKPPDPVTPAAAAPAATQQAATAPVAAQQQPAATQQQPAATQQPAAATAAQQQPTTATGTGATSGASATGTPAASTQSPPAVGGGAAPVNTTSPAPQSTAPPATGQAVAGGASAPQGQG
jgi:hypothetical protein